MKTVMFACSDNAGLSPMAAVFFNSLVNQDLVKAVSAGLEPAERMHHEVVQSMKELMVNLSRVRPRLLTPETMKEVHWVVTLGANPEYPIPPELLKEHWTLEETKDKPIERVRQIRNRIETLVREYVVKMSWMKSPHRQTAEWAPTGL